MFHLSFNAQVGKALVPFIRRNLRAGRMLLINRGVQPATKGGKSRLAEPFAANLSEQSRALTELSIALVNDAKMSDLHLQFMNMPGPTDVLTFPLDTDDAGYVSSGEIVICIPEARRRAALHEGDLRHEVLLYAVHGLLHLLGMDDTTKRAFRDMHRLEDQILIRLGIGNVFASGQPPLTARDRRVGKG